MYSYVVGPADMWYRRSSRSTRQRRNVTVTIWFRSMLSISVFSRSSFILGGFIFFIFQDAFHSVILVPTLFFKKLCPRYKMQYLNSNPTHSLFKSENSGQVSYGAGTHASFFFPLPHREAFHWANSPSTSASNFKLVGMLLIANLNPLRKRKEKMKYHTTYVRCPSSPPSIK